MLSLHPELRKQLKLLRHAHHDGLVLYVFETIEPPPAPVYRAHVLSIAEYTRDAMDVAQGHRFEDWLDQQEELLREWTDDEYPGHEHWDYEVSVWDDASAWLAAKHGVTSDQHFDYAVTVTADAITPRSPS